MRSDWNNKIMIACSISIVTLLHYLTLTSQWGIHDFYRRLYYIPIILAAFKFKLRGGVISSLVVTALYAPHMLLFFGKINIDVINQSLEILMFIIVGAMTGALVQSESKARHLLETQIVKLTNLENFTQNILDSILNGVIAIDKDLKITSVNREGKNIFNLDSADKYTKCLNRAI